MRESRVNSLAKMAPLALLALALLAVPAFGAGAAGSPGLHSPAAHLQMLAQKLNLTEDQQASMKQLFQDFQAKMQPIHQAQQALHTQLKSALAVANPDAATVGQVVIQMHQNRAQIKPITTAFHQQLEALLTPDQLTQFKAMQANHPAFRHHWAGSNPSQ